MKAITLVVLSLILLNGCNNSSSDDNSTVIEENLPLDVPIPGHLTHIDNLKAYPIDSEPTHEIILTKVVEFGEFLEPDLNEIDVPPFSVDENGNIYHADGRENSIKVYTPEGTLLTTLGRTGRGPGEFADIFATRLDHGLVYASDPYQHRVNFYSTDSLKLSNMMLMDPSNWNYNSEIRSISIPTIMQFNNDSTFIGRVILKRENNLWYTGIYHFHINGQLLSDQILKVRLKENVRVDISHLKMNPFLGIDLPPGMEMPPPMESMGGLVIPLERKPLIQIGNDVIYSAWTEEFLIHVHSFTGDTLRSIYYPVVNQPVNMEDYIDKYFEYDNPQYGDGVENALRDFDYYTTWPVLNDLIVDDEGRLWVSSLSENDEMYDWWVLSSQGELIAQFEFPKENSVHIVKNNTLYTMENDDVGYSNIVSYRIDLTEKTLMDNLQ